MNSDYDRTSGRKSRREPITPLDAGDSWKITIGISAVALFLLVGFFLFI